MSIESHLSPLAAKALIARAIGNLLQVVVLRIRACDGYDEDTDQVILAVEVALRHLNAAMSLIIDDGHRRGTITDHEALQQALISAEEFRRIAFVESRGSLELYPFIGATQALIITARGLCNGPYTSIVVDKVKLDVGAAAES